MKNNELYPEESIEIFGNSILYADGFLKIEEYREETVKFRFKNFRLRIIGDGLLLSDVKKRACTVTGTIFSLDYTE